MFAGDVGKLLLSARTGDRSSPLAPANDFATAGNGSTLKRCQCRYCYAVQCLLIFLFRNYFRLSENNFNDDDSNEDEDEEWAQRRYSLQLNEPRGYRRNKAKVSAQPRLDSEDENEQPSELLSRQNTM